MSEPTTRWTLAALMGIALLPGAAVLLAQEEIQVINFCGAETVTLPPYPDLDHDQFSDDVETVLLERYAPVIWRTSAESCPSGVPLTGDPDGRPNLVPCRIYHLPSQWLPPGAKPGVNPIPIDPDTGFVWFSQRVIMSCAVLYGKDCGSFGHPADVEPFHIRLGYNGFAPGAARYDTDLAHWAVGGWIETYAHQGTICERRENGPYQVPGAVSYQDLLSARNKHGNFLTQSRCSAGFACADTCDRTTRKDLLYVNVGEPGGQLVTDLGDYRPDYAGENPWGDTPFLWQYSPFVGAGTIRSKLQFEQFDVLSNTGPPLTCLDVCDWFETCQGCEIDQAAVYEDCVIGCQTTGLSRWRCRGFFPRPTITSIEPDRVTAGGGDFTLTAAGTKIGSYTTIRVDGLDHPTELDGSTGLLTTTVTAAEIEQPGTRLIQLANPPPGGGASEGLILTVDPAAGNPVPVIASLSPATVGAGQAGVALTVLGAGFVVGSAVQVDGAPRATSYLSPAQLTATLLAGDVAAAGVRAITVFNPAPGGGLSNPATLTITSDPPANPVPVLSSLAPAVVAAGGTGFDLTVLGGDFVAGATVLLDGTARPTTFVAATHLIAAIAGSDIAAEGARAVQVLNPGPGGGNSNVLALAVTAGPAGNPEPTLSALVPDTVMAGGAGFTLAVLGGGFIPDSKVKWNGSDRATTYVGPDQLLAAIPAADVAVAGSANVKVKNPTPGGGTSNVLTITIEPPPPNPTPTLFSITPDSVVAGGPDFILTADGADFVSGAVVKVNGESRGTTFVSASRVRAVILASDVLFAGTVNVKVKNPDPGGGNSNVLPLTAEDPPANPTPTLFAIAPDTVFGGGPDFVLTVDGADFVPGAVVKLSSSNRETTFVSSTRLTAVILAADIAAEGTRNVKVKNPEPGGGNSNVLPLVIEPNPVPVIFAMSPTAVAAGSGPVTVTIDGSGFVPGSSVRVHGSGRVTTYVSPERLTAIVTAADVAVPGTLNVKAKNPLPGGGASNIVVLTVQ